MKPVEIQIDKINRLYKMIREAVSENQKTIYRRQVKELEDDLLEYCSWRKLDYKEIYAKVVK